MGWKYGGEYGMVAGFTWAVLCNVQEHMPYYRRPWLHASGMVVGYTLMKMATQWEDAQLQFLIKQYERKGYNIPEDRKKLFEPREYV